MGNVLKDILYLSTNRIMYRRLYFIGIAAYVVLFILSLVFYKERTIFLDMAYDLFYIIKDQTFCLQLHRFGDVFSQLLPIIAVRSGWPVNAIFAVSSSGFVIYYFTTYFICGSILKRYDLALVILLLNILFVSDTFYWMLSQLPQAIAMLIIILALIAGKQFKAVTVSQWTVLLLTECTVTFFHPLVMFVLLFAVVFFFLVQESFTDRKLLYTITIIYFTGIIIKTIFFRSHYEGSAMSGMKNFITQFPDYFTLFSNRRFLYNCLAKYYWIPILFTGITVFYAKTGETKKLWYFVLSFFAYLALVNISYPTAATPEFYIENLYLPLSVFLALPFVFDVLPVLQKKQLAVPVLVLIILSGCCRIYSTHTVYTARLGYERRYLNKYGDNKVIIKAQQADMDTLQMLWGTPYEFLLLSESERNKPASIIVDAHPENMVWATAIKTALRVNWSTIPYTELSRKYFQFTDTVTGYRIIE
jgi:hypothetical protein